MSNLREKYNTELKAVLQEKLGMKNVMAVPKLTKVVINMGVGEAANDKKHLESAVQNKCRPGIEKNHRLVILIC